MSDPLPPPRPLSPCIGVCVMEESSGLCRGCLRTIGEIIAWGGLSAEEREVVWQAIEARRREGETPGEARRG